MAAADPIEAEELTIVILAAGRGTRMRNDRPKVLHELAGKSLIAHVLDLASSLRPVRLVTVLGSGMEAVAAETRRVAPEGRIVIQDPPLGTGHALAVAAPALPESGTVLVLYGDTPLLTRATLLRLLERRAREGAAVTVLGMRPPDPAGYGRLRADPDGRLHAIVEDRHCDAELLAQGLCNAGVLALAADRLRPLLAELPRQAASGEHYLTDAVGLAVARGWPCSAIEGDWIEGQGVNTQAQLALVAGFFQTRRRSELMAEGVVMEAPETVMLSADTAIGPGAVIEPFVVFRSGVTVEPGAVIHAHSYLERAHIGAGAEIGPFARLRPGAEIGVRGKVGNFVEVKNAKLGTGAKASHLTYLGDCEVGAGANIGAGTVTCNYDGYMKHRTVIGEAAFVGSNTALVAPVTIGERVVVGAGSVVTADVPADALVLSRVPQRTLEGAGARLRARLGLEKMRRKS